MLKEAFPNGMNSGVCVLVCQCGCMGMDEGGARRLIPESVTEVVSEVPAANNEAVKGGGLGEAKYPQQPI